MTDPITITADQAEKVQAGEPFVVDGRCSMCRAIGESCDVCPIAEWTAADQPCPTCERLLEIRKREHCEHDGGCTDCHDTDRDTIELRVGCPTYGETHIGGPKGGTGHCGQSTPCVAGWISLGLFTVQCLPIVHNRNTPMLGGAYFVEVWGNGDAVIWRDGQSEQITLPPDAQPGQYAVVATKVEI